jgi:hypothetical protein
VLAAPSALGPRQQIKWRNVSQSGAELRLLYARRER